MALALTIGDVFFDSFEIPERLPVAWKQSRAVNEYPGGTRTVYAMGSFPRPMQWTGWLMGSSAFARVSALERLCAAGLQVEMEYGPFAWLGLVVDFSAQIEHQFKISYQMTFEPQADISGIGNVPPLVAAAEALLGVAVSAFAAIGSGVESGLALPSALAAPAAAVTGAVTAGLLDSAGVVANMTTSDVSAITVAVGTLETDAAPFIAGTDATQASSALDISAYGANIGAIAAVPKPGVRLLNGQVNPNLFAIAAQYLGDATAWQSIAAASGINPPDPMPVGMFTLVVP